MEIKITEDFFIAFSALQSGEQKKVRETIFSIKNQGSNAGLRFHKIAHPSNRIFSYSTNKDIRIISHQNDEYTTLMYVDHHDASYNWIKKRKIIDVSNNGISIIVSKESDEYIDNQLANEIHKIKTINNEVFNELLTLDNDDEIMDYILKQPPQFQDELLDYINKKSKVCSIVPDHYIKVLNDDAELENALKYPLELWRVFIHPIQQKVIEKHINESIFITGCPGTGKTVCLIHKIKIYEKLLDKNECLILTTFKHGLMEYLYKMLRMVEYDNTKIFIDDISSIKLHKGNITNTAIIDGLFQICDESLYYYKNGRKLKVRHLFFDEYQDFRNGQISIIKKLINNCPFTLSFDYSQAIYRTVRSTIDELELNKKTELIKLDYSYRINSNILNNLKQIIKVIRILSNESMKLGNLGLMDMEEELIQNSKSAIIGSPLILGKYNDSLDLESLLIRDYEILKGNYKADEIVITSFFEDLYKNLQEDELFHSEFISKKIRGSYKYAPTLKGMEYKAGLLILDETICQMLNINRSIFIGKVDTGFLGGASNYRLNINLFYVLLSRFRDYLKIYYPAKYEIIIKPLFEF